MRANIPLLRQPVNSSLCGEACLKMLYGYYGVKKSIYQIRDELQNIRKTFKNGSLLFELALHLVRGGFGCEMKMWPASNNVFACKKFQQISQADLLKELRALFKKSKVSRYLDCRLLLKFIEEGGKVIPKITQLKEIKERISDGIIVLLNYSYLNSKIVPCVNDVGHFAVPVEISKGKIILNDPHFKENVILAEHEFLFMFYTADAGILFVSKQ
jgi:hypothetical protein